MSDWEFIFDGIFGFLSSPIWIVPVNAFIEEQSVVFDESEENILEWTKVHKRYSSLIESLLSSYLKDVGITDEQFIEACKTPTLQQNKALQQVFEQLWAADDFEIFKRMMVQRNIELQLQALQLIKRRQGKKSSTKHKSRKNKTEDEILAEVLKKSELEYQESQQNKEEEKKTSEQQTPAENLKIDNEMEKLITESNEESRLQTEVQLKEQETKQAIEENIAKTEKVDDDVSKEEPSKSKSKSHDLKKEPMEQESKSSPSLGKSKKEKSLPPLKKQSGPLKPLKQTVKDDVSTDWIKQTPAGSPKIEKSSESEKKAEVPESSKPKADDNSKDLEQRVAYLRQQRTRLLELKRVEREKQLNQYTQSQSRQRPTSARIAKQAMGAGTGSASAVDESAKPSAEEEKRIAMRKALAEKLKKEVIYK